MALRSLAGPGAENPTVADEGRAEHSVPAGHDRGELLGLEEQAAVLEAQQVFVEPWQGVDRVVEGRRGVCIEQRWIDVHLGAVVGGDRDRVAGGCDPALALGRGEAGPPREVLSRRRTVAAEVARRQCGECIVAVEPNGVGHPVVEQHEGLLAVDVGRDRADASLAGIPEHVIAELALDGQAGQAQIFQQCRTGEPTTS